MGLRMTTKSPNQFVVSVFLLFSLCRCDLTQGFQPPPDENEVWSKEGSTKDSVSIALLECGWATPQYFRDFNSEGGNDIADDAVASVKCMEAQGYKSQYGSEELCANLSSMPPACDKAFVPPKPERKLRLEGTFCKTFNKSTYCK